MLKFLLIFILLGTVPARAEKDVITEVYQVLASDYINKTDNRAVTLKGLEALEQIDPQTKVSLTDKKAYLYHQNKIVKSFDLPSEETDLNGWRNLCRDIIEKAVTVSDKIELLDFEIPDRFAQNVFKDLDGYSHYYGEFGNQDSPQTIWRRHYAERMIDDILMFKILDFHQGVSQKVSQAIEECSSCRGFILDLRGNHGGILDEAIKIADLFLDEGIVAYTSEKDKIAPKYYTVSAGDMTHNKPLVILIDGFSASASEVLAAALSEQNRAVLVGTRTFGKGTVQDVIKLDNSHALALTTAYFYTPSGIKIDKNGLNPAICSGKIKKINDLHSADCERADRFNEEVDVEIAVKYIKNEL